MTLTVDYDNKKVIVTLDNGHQFFFGNRTEAYQWFPELRPEPAGPPPAAVTKEQRRELKRQAGAR